MLPLDKPVPPLPKHINLNRQYSYRTAYEWLESGWQDFKQVNMEASLLYGIVVFALSGLIVFGLFVLRLDYVLFPALAAFLVIGPTLAIGLYEKSRRIELNQSVSIGHMLSAKAQQKGQILFIGLLLSLWVLLWLRAGVLLYALFFGMHPFPGFAGLLHLLFTNSAGWGLFLTGSLFGALFAAFGFAVSVISVPMLLNEDTDAFSAMGASITLCWHNLPVMLMWGCIVAALFALCVFTFLFGLIVIYPVLGHATWHVYRAIRQNPDTPIFVPAILDSEVDKV